MLSREVGIINTFILFWSSLGQVPQISFSNWLTSITSEPQNTEDIVRMESFHLGMNKWFNTP